MPRDVMRFTDHITGSSFETITQQEVSRPRHITEIITSHYTSATSVRKNGSRKPVKLKLIHLPFFRPFSTRFPPFFRHSAFVLPSSYLRRTFVLRERS